MSKVFIAGLLALLIIAVTQGQEDLGPPDGGPPEGPPPAGPGGPPFGGPRFGGPGFGPPGMGGQFGPGSLLGMKEVQDELKLTKEQRTKLSEQQEKLQEQLRTLGEKTFDDGESLDEDERWQRFESLRDESDKLTCDSLKESTALLTPEQATRFEELRLQREGVDAMLRPDNVEKLSLTEDQQEQLRELQGGPRFFGPPDRQQRSTAQALAILTEEQRGEWTKMQGAAFKFPEFRGFGGPGGGERELVARFDQDHDGRLNAEERKAARESLKNEPQGGGPGGFGRRGGGRGPGGPPRGFGPESEKGSPGPKVSVEDVPAIDAPLYDSNVVRTIFLDFENPDWEQELADFNNSDVEVPATMTVDGKTYPGVGVHFRGMSSYFTVQAGSKRSLNVSMDFTNADQRLLGYKTLNLLNSHEDPSFLHTVLYFDIARNYLPAPKANFVRVVINGESWGLYVNAQQYNKEFVEENFSTTKGTRWKVQGSPGGRGGLEYLGDDPAEYRKIYTIKSKDTEKAWKALITLCKTLNETPLDQLEAALEPMLDVDEALWFLALENALINSDGYWVRASDYCIYLDVGGKFHIIPHDANETFQPGMGFGGPGRGRNGRGGPPQFGPGGNRRPERADNPGAPPGPRFGGPDAGPPPEGRGPEGPGGPRGRRGERGRGPGFGPPGGFAGGRGGPGDARRGGVELDPLVGLDDSSKPLRSRLLSIPSLKKRYLEHVRTIANDWLNWEKLGPIVNGYADLIGPVVQDDTRKLSSYEAFEQATSASPGESEGRRMPIRAFAEQRRKALLNHKEIKALDESK